MLVLRAKQLLLWSIVNNKTLSLPKVTLKFSKYFVTSSDWVLLLLYKLVSWVEPSLGMGLQLTSILDVFRLDWPIHYLRTLKSNSTQSELIPILFPSSSTQSVYSRLNVHYLNYFLLGICDLEESIDPSSNNPPMQFSKGFFWGDAYAMQPTKCSKN